MTTADDFIKSASKWLDNLDASEFPSLVSELVSLTVTESQVPSFVRFVSQRLLPETHLMISDPEQDMSSTSMKELKEGRLEVSETTIDLLSRLREFNLGEAEGHELLNALITAVADVSLGGSFDGLEERSIKVLEEAEELKVDLISPESQSGTVFSELGFWAAELRADLHFTLGQVSEGLYALLDADQGHPEVSGSNARRKSLRTYMLELATSGSVELESLDLNSNVSLLEMAQSLIVLLERSPDSSFSTAISADVVEAKLKHLRAVIADVGLDVVLGYLPREAADAEHHLDTLFHPDDDLLVSSQEEEYSAIAEALPLIRLAVHSAQLMPDAQRPEPTGYTITDFREFYDGIEEGERSTKALELADSYLSVHTEEFEDLDFLFESGILLLGELSNSLKELRLMIYAEGNDSDVRMLDRRLYWEQLAQDRSIGVSKRLCKLLVAYPSYDASKHQDLTSILYSTVAEAYIDADDRELVFSAVTTILDAGPRLFSEDSESARLQFLVLKVELEFELENFSAGFQAAVAFTEMPEEVRSSRQWLVLAFSVAQALQASAFDATQADLATNEFALTALEQVMPSIEFGHVVPLTDTILVNIARLDLDVIFKVQAELVFAIARGYLDGGRLQDAAVVLEKSEGPIGKLESRNSTEMAGDLEIALQGLRQQIEHAKTRPRPSRSQIFSVDESRTPEGLYRRGFTSTGFEPPLNGLS